MAEQRVRLQNLRDFTVQIRRPTDDAIVGTGVAVSTAGQIVTCAHVVEAALGVHPRDADGAEVGVYFPQARGGEEKARRATVAGCFEQHDDDVVLLQLADGPAPLAPEQIAVLGRAEESCYHPFRSYGYRRLEDYIAGHAHGTILGCVEPPVGQDVQAEPVQLESQQINCGMSGSAVLDVDRNLVVGIVSETWFPDLSTKDRDTAWAVDARVLTFDPLNLPLHDMPLPKQPAPQPKTDVAAARAAVAPDGVAFHGAPPPLAEWVGRDDLLQSITRDWTDSDRHVTGLIGFGGEGKSSLARKWVDSLGNLPNCPTPDGIFWWAFYDRPNVDEFFEAALAYMGGGRIDPRRVPSASVRAQVIGAMLGAGRYLFVLDGLEVMQHQKGDQYGLLKSNDLRDFLALFAAPGHESFCLVTSRAPLLDLMAYTTYTHRDVTRLSPTNGRALLREVGVRGADDALDKIVADWDGHALTLGLLGTHLATQYGGDVARAGEIDPPTVDEPRYERVHRVLRRYDEHLTETECAFLTLFSAFRTPVEELVFGRVFRAEPEEKQGFVDPVLGRKPKSLNAPIAALDDAAFDAMVQRLLTYRILRHDRRTATYTAHPLVRNHYFARLTAGGRQTTQDAHEHIKEYYLELAGNMPRFPTLDDLAPLIEVVHHACHAGTYGEGLGVLSERIYKLHLRRLGAYEIALSVMKEFFPGGDIYQDSQIESLEGKSWILNAAGFCVMSLGHLHEAVHLFERANTIVLSVEDWHNASIGYRDLAELQAHLGDLVASADSACKGLALAYRTGDEHVERLLLVSKAWAAHLQGMIDVAHKAFQLAEALEQKLEARTRYLYAMRGIQHTDYLRRSGDWKYARSVAETNLRICELQGWSEYVSRSHRVLGDLDTDAGQHESARAHYDEALKIARSIAVRDVLIEALLARGRWTARCACQTSEVSQILEVSAFSDLNEALGYTVDSGYRIYETDIRVALAWAHLAAGDPERACQEAERAQQMSIQMGYHWGQVDAAEVLAAVDKESAAN